MKKLVIIGVAALLATVSVEAQTNLNVANTAPYFSVTNSPLLNNATILANDPVAATAVGVNGTNNYAYGTNYSGSFIYPFAVTRALNVAFGLTVTTTNSAQKGVYIATFEAGNGIGDWTTIATLPVSATTGSVNLAAGTTNVFTTNTTINVGGFDYFRLKYITQSGESNYTATASAAFSSKPGL